MKIAISLLLSMAGICIYEHDYFLALFWLLPALFLLVLIVFEKKLLED